MLHGMEPAEARDAEWRRGTLPPGRLGWRKATEICEQAVLLADAARGYRSAKADAVDVDIDLGGRRIDGHGVAGVRRPAGLGDVLEARR